MSQLSLHEFLTQWSKGDDTREPVASTIAALAGVSIRIAEGIWREALKGTGGEIVGSNTDGDSQKALDIIAHEQCLEALRHAPVSYVISEEEQDAIKLSDTGPLDVAMDPLDGSSNIDTNLSVGTIFSILPTSRADDGTMKLLNGEAQKAAGFFIYGPTTALVLTVLDGVQIFVLDRSTGRYVLVNPKVEIALRRPEYAINASNYRHWEQPIRTYIDDCIVGIHGPREENFNMRWVASLVAEAYRIFARGGIFLYPRDGRPGYDQGRLRLMYETNPIALLVEQAGGGAIDGSKRILELEPTDIHQRSPLIFGSIRMTERVARYHDEFNPDTTGSPLFGARSLFRAN